MKIFIDAGHNYKKFDLGAIGSNLKEQDVTFRVAKLISDILSTYGVLTKLSRKHLSDSLGTNLNSSLNTRAKMANDWGCDLFISLHCGSSYDQTKNGVLSYVYKKSEHIDKLAHFIHHELSNRLKLEDRGVFERNITVLRETKSPALFIQMAFITNPHEEQLLMEKENIFAGAIADGIMNFLELR